MSTPDNDNFEQWSWHDNHVHGLSIRAGEHGTGELVLDIDHILEWLPPVENHISFRVAPATLTFHRVSDLTLSLDYVRVSAGLTPFAIEDLQREPYTYPNGYTSYRWHIRVNWPEGGITFFAPRFTQVLRATPITTSDPCLRPDQRENLGSGA